MFLARTPFYSKHVIHILMRRNITVLSGRIQ
jgi:hypothetical protein